MTDEDDAPPHGLTRMPGVRPPRNRVVDNARLSRGNPVREKLLLDEARIRNVLVDAGIETRYATDTDKTVPIREALPSRSTTRTPKRRRIQSAGPTHDRIEFRCEDMRRTEPPRIAQQIETRANDVPHGLQAAAERRAAAESYQ